MPEVLKAAFRQEKGLTSETPCGKNFLNHQSRTPEDMNLRDPLEFILFLAWCWEEYFTLKWLYRINKIEKWVIFRSSRKIPALVIDDQ